jgi:hypothetical protein
VREVAIRTEKHPNSAVVIWVVVADDEVFVRSVRGTKGRWHRDLAAGGPATLEFAGRWLAVQTIPESDPAAVARASCEYPEESGNAGHEHRSRRGSAVFQDAVRTEEAAGVDRSQLHQFASAHTRRIVRLGVEKDGRQLKVHVDDPLCHGEKRTAVVQSKPVKLIGFRS